MRLRFIAVTRPLSYARHKNSRRVLVTIVITWIISASVSSPIVAGINYTPRRHEHPSLCTFYNSDFLIYSSMASFYVPCVIMTVLYGRIFRAIRSRERKTQTSSATSGPSSAAARRLSCVGGGSTTLHPPPTTSVAPTPQTRPPCFLEEATVDRPDGCSSVVVDAPRSPPPRPADNDDDDVDDDDIGEGGPEDADATADDGRRQQALPILLLPSGESPRNDDSFECESDRVLAMLPTPYVPSTKVIPSHHSLSCYPKNHHRARFITLNMSRGHTCNRSKTQQKVIGPLQVGPLSIASFAASCSLCHYFHLSSHSPMKFSQPSNLSIYTT